LPPGTEVLRLSILKEILKGFDSSAVGDRIRSQNMLAAQIDA